MRIEVDKIAKTGGDFTYTYAPAELALNDEAARLTSAPEIRARVKRHGERIDLRGHISARVEVDCDRCLKIVDVPVETNFAAAYVPAILTADLDKEAELHDEDLDVAVLDGDAIDVDELVREQVLLALPLHALCADDCKGLCPACGTNKNINAACGCEQKEIDPRWAALKNF